MFGCLGRILQGVNPLQAIAENGIGLDGIGLENGMGLGENGDGVANAMGLGANQEVEYESGFSRMAQSAVECTNHAVKSMFLHENKRLQ